MTTIPVDGPFDFLSTKDAVVDKNKRWEILNVNLKALST